MSKGAINRPLSKVSSIIPIVNSKKARAGSADKNSLFGSKLKRKLVDMKKIPSNNGMSDNIPDPNPLNENASLNPLPPITRPYRKMAGNTKTIFKKPLSRRLLGLSWETP